MTELGNGLVLGEGRYRLVERCGSGGMAVVWKAQDERLERPVAIKIIADTLAAERPYLLRFEREATIAANLAHPAVVKVFDYEAEIDRPYLVMEWISGGTLQELLERGERVDVELLATEMLSALAHIHAAGIIHRDVKPANVLFTDDGRPVVTDFGIAQAPEATRITTTGLVLGTRRYIAPEVATGGESTPSSDLYAFGVMLREALQGRPGSDQLEHLITLLTRRDPAERPSSAEAALALLAQAAVTSDGSSGSGSAATEPTQIMTRERPAHTSALTSTIAWFNRLPVSGRQLGFVLAALVLAGVVALAIAVDRPPSEPQLERPAPKAPPLDEQLDRLEELVRALGEGD